MAYSYQGKRSQGWAGSSTDTPAQGWSESGYTSRTSGWQDYNYNTNRTSGWQDRTGPFNQDANRASGWAGSSRDTNRSSGWQDPDLAYSQGKGKGNQRQHRTPGWNRRDYDDYDEDPEESYWTQQWGPTYDLRTM